MDAIFFTSAVTTWALNKLLDRLKDAAIEALLKSEDLTTEVKDLVHALDRAKLILGSLSASASAGVEFGNLELAPQITEVHDKAVKLAKHLDKLEYYEIGKKVRCRTWAIGSRFLKLDFLFNPMKKKLHTNRNTWLEIFRKRFYRSNFLQDRHFSVDNSYNY
jgi:hypothetical protein